MAIVCSTWHMHDQSYHAYIYKYGSVLRSSGYMYQIKSSISLDDMNTLFCVSYT